MQAISLDVDVGTIKDFLTHYWEKEHGAKVFWQQMKIAKYRIDGIIILPKLSLKEKEEKYHHLIKEICTPYKNLNMIPTDLEVIAIRIIKMKRSISYFEYVKAKNLLRKVKRIDKVMLIVNRPSWLLKKYCMEDPDTLILEFGEVVSFMRKRGMIQNDI